MVLYYLECFQSDITMKKEYCHCLVKMKYRKLGIKKIVMIMLYAFVFSVKMYWSNIIFSGSQVCYLASMFLFPWVGKVGTWGQLYFATPLETSAPTSFAMEHIFRIFMILHHSILKDIPAVFQKHWCRLSGDMLFAK